MAPATINKLLQTLRTILERAALDGWIIENPADHARPVRAPRRARAILSPEETMKLLASPRPLGDFRNRPLYHLPEALMRCDIPSPRR